MEAWELEGHRIPDISEFVDGFRFQVYSPGYWQDSVEDFCGWYYYEMGRSNWRDIDEIERELKDGNIRVSLVS